MRGNTTTSRTTASALVLSALALSERPIAGRLRAGGLTRASLITGLLGLAPFSVFGFTASLVVLPPVAASAQTGDAIIDGLSGYHMNVSVEQLETAAGGRDALISRLLEIRHLEKPPFVGVRAAKILLSLSDDPRVADGLADDMDQYLGLARLITSNLDTVPSPANRERFAKLALARAAREAKFVPYARVLIESKDESISRLAKAQLE